MHEYKENWTKTTKELTYWLITYYVYFFFYILQNSGSLYLTFKKDTLPVFNF